MNSDSDSRLNTFSPVAPASPLDALHPHSKYCEYVLSINEIAVAFMRFVLRNSPILPHLRLDKLKVEPGSFLDAQTLKGSEADVVYSIPLEFSNGEQQEALVYTLLEHKSSNDYNAVRQLARYYTHLLFLDDRKEQNDDSSRKSTEIDDSSAKTSTKTSRKLPLIIPILFHHGAEPYTGPRELKEFFPEAEGFEDFIINFKPIVIDLTTIDLKELPNEPNEKVFNFVMTVIKLVFQEKNFEDVETCFLELFPEVKKHPKYLDLARTSIQYFWAASHTDHNRFLNLIANHYPQENEGGENTVLSLLEKSFLEGRQEGREEGRQEGLEEGILQAKQTAVVNALKTRFQDVPEEISARLGSIQDEVVLDSLLIEAILCKSLDDFKQKL